jgi:hypothetical protein
MNKCLIFLPFPFFLFLFIILYLHYLYHFLIILQIANPPTMQEICEDLQKFYLKKVVPFLANLGVAVYGDEKYWWKWSGQVSIIKIYIII